MKDETGNAYRKHELANMKRVSLIQKSWLAHLRIRQLGHPGLGRCLLCLLPSDAASDLCLYCRTDLPRLNIESGFLNSHCDQPKNIGTTEQYRLLRRSHAAAVVTPLAYEREVVWLINQQKHRSGRVASRVLAELLADSIAAAYAEQPLPSRVIPVPLHWYRELRRGVNQSEVLAHWLSKRLPIKVHTNWVRRNRMTHKQSLLGHAERQANVAQAFSATRAGRRQIPGRSIALLDDVLTTGATLGALATSVRAAGAGEIHLWTPARAM